MFMILYLVQHGEAKPESEDPQRSLTQRGREAIRLVAEWAARAGVKVDQIRHSGKLRAEQTAGILAERLAPSSIHGTSGLGPNDDIRPVAESLEQEARATMLVGHLPFLSRLASYLLIRDPDHPLVRFQMGGIVCLFREGGKWFLAWSVPPDLAK
jgi:phosphohistidine phosphatase